MGRPSRCVRRSLRTGLVMAAVGAGTAHAQTSSEAQTAPAAASAAAVSGGAATPREPPAAAPDAGLALAEYQAALAARRLDASGPLGTEQLAEIVRSAESRLAMGRRDEAIAMLAAVVESDRFEPLASLDEGRAATYLLGDALGRAGAYALSRGYLTRLLGGSHQDTWFRRAVARLVDLGVESGDARGFLELLPSPPRGSGAPWASDAAYLRGLALEREGEAGEALEAYAEVSAQSRFWAQATYRAGLLEVEARRFTQGEQLFCRLADPKQTPRTAPLLGGNAFFEIRDLSRLALGRVAHEQYRFDDARYYYHLVPADSEHLPEALYESATARYEARDYPAARALLDELAALGTHHVYSDEASILDAYVDLAQCEFPRADAKLAAFLARYEPVLAAARQLSADARALRSLLGAEEAAVAAELGWSRDVVELLRSSLRVDASYGRVSRQIVDLDHQLGGLLAAREEMAQLSAAVTGDAARARPALAVPDAPADRLERLAEQTAAVRRMLREAAAQGRAEALVQARQELAAIERDMEAQRMSSRRLELALAPAGGRGLPELLARDVALASELEHSARGLRDQLASRQEVLAREALARLELRLARLVRRARAGRIETVLGRKRALELEVEALSQGFLPQGAVDSLDAARYLADDEEYWPFDGEDWEDEYVGGEGLR